MLSQSFGTEFQLELGHREDGEAQQALLDRADFKGRIVAVELLEVVAVRLELFLCASDVELGEFLHIVRDESVEVSVDRRDFGEKLIIARASFA